jgi:hypothetical protein
MTAKSENLPILSFLYAQTDKNKELHVYIGFVYVSFFLIKMTRCDKI